MALNVTFDGFCSLDDSTMSNVNVQYQAYFFKVNGGSSSSTWNTVRTVEATGYWNVNLGDGDWLTQNGQQAPGDKVMIVFWRNGARLGTDCSVLAEWGAFEITLDGSETYTNPTQVKENILPNLIWTFPVEAGPDYYVDTTYNATNNSNDVHTWNWSGTTMGHHYYWNSEQIYYVNYVRLSHYDWDDGDQDINQPLAANGSHSWALHGDYTVELVIEDHCTDTVTGTENIRIKYPPPTPDIICHQTIVSGGDTIDDPDTVVTFAWDGGDPYSRITGIEWVIEDDTNSTYSGTRDDIVPHPSGTGTSWYGHTSSPGAFTDPGTHNVAIVVYWNDGFDDQVLPYDEDFIQDYFDGPTLSFYQDPNPVPVWSGVEFYNTTTDSEDRVGTSITHSGSEYDWEWDDDGTIDTVIDVPKSYVYGNTPTTDNVTIELCTYWNDGWSDYEICLEKDLAIATTVEVVKEECYYELYIYGTSSDGSVDGYSWEISRSTTSGLAGPYEVMWTSPEGMDHRAKTICFGEQNYFRVVGFVHGTGTTTSDTEYIQVEDVCPGEECTLIIWNGTGEFDYGGDWDHSSHGSEEAYAKYEGTNGLDATGFTNNKKIHFQDTDENNVDEYDLLSMYINLKEWEDGKDVTLYFEDGNSVNLSDYLETFNENEWQRVLIPLEVFGLTEPINLKRLTYESGGDMGFYLDNVEFVIGATIREVVAIERPEMDADLLNTPKMGAEEFDPTPVMNAFPFNPNNL